MFGDGRRVLPLIQELCEKFITIYKSQGKEQLKQRSLLDELAKKKEAKIVSLVGKMLATVL